MASPVLVVAALCCVVLAAAAETVEDKAFWMKVGQDELKDRLNVIRNYKQAKNVILFLGDGMGMSTVTAGRIYKGQKDKKNGEETKLNFEKFPYTAFSKTYTVDRQTSDSAGSGTAIASGVKVNYGTVGFDARVQRGDCTMVSNTSVYVETVLDWSLAEGKSVGIVTTARVTHATPAAMYAHSVDRNWETDKDIPAGCKQLDIAKQLVEENSGISVILGGGKAKFSGRKDNKTLTDDWLAGQKAKGRSAAYITTAAQLRSLNTETTDSVFGTFTNSHMTWELTRDNNLEPSIGEMATTAIKIMRKNSKGYFLLVEGARIDHGHHDNWAKRALEETVAMDNAVGEVIKMVGDDTLVVVTADHSHPFNIVGYPKRGNNILGLVDPVADDQKPTDGKPYSTLIYGDGPGPGRENPLVEAEMQANDYMFPRAVPMKSEWETHGGEDVGIYATGPMAHLFSGTHEQNYIAHVLAYVSCVGPNKDHCKTKTSGAGGLQGKVAGPMALMLAALLVATFNRL